MRSLSTPSAKRRLSLIRPPQSQRKSFLPAVLLALAAAAPMASRAADPPRHPLDPRGRIHIPIGIADTLDTLKTFVEAEGVFSPGFGSYGVYLWVFDHSSRRLIAPTLEGVKCERGLSGRGFLIPWVAWEAGRIAVRMELCQVRRPSPAGTLHVVGLRARLENRSPEPAAVSLYAALRPLGPAGFAVEKLAVSEGGDALLVDGRAALVGEERAGGAGVSCRHTIGDLAMEGKLPSETQTSSSAGDASGALRHDLTLAAGEARVLRFVCPVLPGRRAARHRWDGKNPWAQLDEAQPNPAEGGELQPDPGLEFYRGLKVDRLFEEAGAYWEDLVGRVKLALPDPRWAECFAAIAGHVALCLNEGAPDVAVVNYNVFNRDGVYTASILQKAGQPALAARCIEHFLAHPFGGRVYPEADNPGQLLWILGEQWLFTRDRAWLDRVAPAAEKLAALVRYLRTTPGPHWVSFDRLEFGQALSEAERQELKPGRCDGFHPEYTEAFDLAGLRAAALLAEARGAPAPAAELRGLAASLFQAYDRKFGERLGREYGSYSVLWPCRLYPLAGGKGREAFCGVGKQKPVGWRYFPLATAHQGLLAGNREAGHGTIALHLEHEQMRGWYAFDEGGKSGAGGWKHVRTTWRGDVAMPHGWAVAELFLLLRDALAFEDEGRLVLLSGIPPEWFTGAEGLAIEGLPTHFGALTQHWRPVEGGAVMKLSGPAAPPGGFDLRLPAALGALVTSPEAQVEGESHLVPAGTRRVEVRFARR